MAKKSKTIQYVFRGTSRNYSGGVRAKNTPATFTTRNPAKAVLFAIVALQHSIDVGIYYAEIVKLKNIVRLNPNRLSKEEEEIIFGITPTKFAELCEGFIPLDMVRGALKKLNIEENFLTENYTKIVSNFFPTKNEKSRIESEECSFAPPTPAECSLYFVFSERPPITINQGK